MNSKPTLLSALVVPDQVIPSPRGELRLPPAATSREALREGLRAAIELGDLPSGSRWKSGNDLATATGMGRSTVGAAVSDLVYAGFLDRQAGGRKTVKRRPVAPQIHIRPRDPVLLVEPVLEYAALLALFEEPSAERLWKQHLDGRCVAEVRLHGDPRWWSPPSRWSWDEALGPGRGVERVHVGVAQEADSSGAGWLVVRAEFHSAGGRTSLSIRLAHGFFSVDIA